MSKEPPSISDDLQKSYKIMETNLRFALNYTRDRFKGYALNVLIKTDKSYTDFEIETYADLMIDYFHKSNPKNNPNDGIIDVIPNSILDPDSEYNYIELKRITINNFMELSEEELFDIMLKQLKILKNKVIEAKIANICHEDM